MVELIQTAGFALIRDLIATILAQSIADQKAQAVLEGKDPDDYDLKVYAERPSAYENWLNADASQTYPPVCNVWYASSGFDKSKSNMIKRQLSDSRYNIDVYGFGVSSPDGAGYASGEYIAADKCHRGVALVTGSLMAGRNVSMGLPARVWDRWVSSVDIFQPEFDGRFVQKVLAARIVLEASFNEFSPQIGETILEYISTSVRRSGSGEFLIGADVDFA